MRLRTAAIISVAAQGTMLFVAFTRMAVISRYLTPEEIGVFAMASAMMIFARVVRIFGIWEYVVATHDLTTDKLRSCFTVMLLMSGFLTLLFVIGADWLSRFLEMPQLDWLVPAMAISFIVLSLAVIGQANMSRQMRFGDLAITRVAAGLTDAVVTLALVFMGYGIISLVAGFLIGAFVSTGLIIYYEPRNILFRPGFRYVGDVLRFGWLATLGSVLSNMTEFGPTLLLGKVFDAPSVAYFTRGRTLISILRQGIEVTTGPVTQSWFARQSRTDPDYVAQGYLMLTGLLSVVTWPAYLFLLFNAPTLVPFLLGDQWGQSVPIAQALACGAMFSGFTVYGLTLLAGKGNVARRMRFSAIDQAVRMLLLVVCAQWGLMAFAWGLAFSHFASFMLMSVFLRIDSQLSIRELILSLKPSALASLPVVAVNLAAYEWLFKTPTLNFWQFALTAILCAIAWFIALALLSHPLLRHFKELVKSPRVAGIFRRPAR